ncbi:Alkaline phosphatase [Altererythrobacter epoxidivorans]|uniref:Alkaline phosphatase n=1 Tax=Altererythrobacter epoxidivorans TaxID=361183 RepID=A0A0M4M9Q9_9SPHN|nr:alkaline phosphatase [Altererythrobacter epoxidivorans]ALE17623.1 Alkaline phosphatase [Altererythrobacter epoxidivorans]
MAKNTAAFALTGAIAMALAACTPATSQGSVESAPVVAATEPTTAKKVILFIGDGMGISTITAARIYAGQKLGQSGEEYVQSFEKFDNVALVKTYNSNAQTPDSAGTASAMNTGVKTKIGVLGIGPEAPHGDCAGSLPHRLETLGEKAKREGLALGIVSTARITHATPAAVYAHIPNRDWEADAAIPADQRGLGCEDIATQLIGTDFDVALGGGRAAFYGKDKGGRRLEDDADLPAAWVQLTGGTYVEDQAALAAAPLDKPVFGVFSPSHMTYMVDRKADSSEPTLTDMTAEAIKRLDSDPDGYYLMVESGRIDHGHHESKAGYALEEAVEFDRAIRYAIEHTDPEETLILVTADHSHVFTMAGYPKRGNPILGLVYPPEGGDEDHGAGGDGPSLAADGKPYSTLGYANGPGAVRGDRGIPDTGVRAQQQSLVPMGSETHGGEDVALFGTGPGSQRVRGVIEQNVIYDIIAKALGWKR